MAHERAKFCFCAVLFLSGHNNAGTAYYTVLNNYVLFNESYTVFTDETPASRKRHRSGLKKFWLLIHYIKQRQNESMCLDVCLVFGFIGLQCIVTTITKLIQIFIVSYF
jgi:hypothetical protein